MTDCNISPALPVNMVKDQREDTKMKITPAKDYKKPLYAVGIAAALMAVSVTGCTDLASGIKSGTKDTRVHRVHSDGIKQDADNEPVYAGEIALDGEVAIDPDYTETCPTDDDIELAGEVDVAEH